MHALGPSTWKSEVDFQDSQGYTEKSSFGVGEERREKKCLKKNYI